MTAAAKANAVVWIASYPKSGNTWVQAVVRHAGRSFGFPNNDLDVYRLIARNEAPQVVRGIRRNVSETETTVLKTHAAYLPDPRLHPRLGLKTAGFVYVMRNPLDMLLSYINFTRLQYANRKDSVEYQQRLFRDLLGFEQPYSFEAWQAMTLDSIPRSNLDHALQRFTELDTDIPALSGTTGGSWLNHCRSWRTAAETLPGVVLRYEDLLAGPRFFLPMRKLFAFDDAKITAAVEAVNQTQRGMQGKKVFYNKMRSYYFGEYFSPEVVARFVDRFAVDLDALGYGDLMTRADN